MGKSGYWAESGPGIIVKMTIRTAACSKNFIFQPPDWSWFKTIGTASRTIVFGMF